MGVGTDGDRTGAWAIVEASSIRPRSLGGGAMTNLDDRPLDEVVDPGRTSRPREHRQGLTWLLLTVALALLATGLLLPQGLVLAAGLVLAGVMAGQVSGTRAGEDSGTRAGED
jgi:hypothetical protein